MYEYYKKTKNIIYEYYKLSHNSGWFVNKNTFECVCVCMLFSYQKKNAINNKIKTRHATMYFSFFPIWNNFFGNYVFGTSHIILRVIHVEIPFFRVCVCVLFCSKRVCPKVISKCRTIIFFNSSSSSSSKLTSPLPNHTCTSLNESL